MINNVNHFADQWWLYIFHVTWQAAIVAAIALAAVYTFRRLPSPWRYAILLIALAKFAFPPIVTTRFGVFHWAGPAVVTARSPLPLGEDKGEGETPTIAMPRSASPAPMTDHHPAAARSEERRVG